MSDTTAKNLGAQINDPKAPVNITNVFEAEKPQTLPSNIPAAKGFVGREDELSVLRREKQNGKTSFVLHGTGGVGKTELALKFIEEVKDEFEARIRVDMQGLANALSPDDAMLEVIRAFEPNVPSLPSEQIEGLYISLLNQHKTLLFFDNARDRDQVESLNQKTAFVVITSRATFNVTGGYSKEIEQMLPKDAINLLYSIAEERRFDGKADELARLTGYLPMALSPLASILAEDITEDAASLIQKYSDRKERLRLADPNRENLSIEASFDLSYERLSDELKERWRRLAVFPADFDLEVLKTLWQDENAKASLSSLIKSNLVIFDGKNKRSRLHDLARDYAREKLSDKELSLAEALHASYYGWLLSNLHSASLENLAVFDLERTNIETGFAWDKEKIQLSDEFAKFCDYYTGYSNRILALRLHPRNFIQWSEIGLTASRKNGNLQGEANYLVTLGYAYDDLGDYLKAIEYYEQTLAIVREISDRMGEAGALGNMGVSYRNLGEYQKAIEFYEAALEIFKEIGNRSGEGAFLGNLGDAYDYIGKKAEGVEYYEKALAIAKEIGDRQRESIWLGNLGNAYESSGEYQKAIDYFEQALIISREIGDRSSEGYQLSNLGLAYANAGETEKAIDLSKKAVQILEEIESPVAKVVRQNLALWNAK